MAPSHARTSRTPPIELVAVHAFASQHVSFAHGLLCAKTREKSDR